MINLFSILITIRYHSFNKKKKIQNFYYLDFSKEIRLADSRKLRRYVRIQNTKGPR